MTVVVGNNSITGVTSIQGPGANAGISINTNGEINFPYRPAFYAYGITGGTWSAPNNVIFPSTTVNIGGHYNTSTGVFTCPIAGIYAFHWSSIGNNSDGTYRMYFHRNGANEAGIHLRLDNTDSGSAYCENLSHSISWNCSQGDTIQVRIEDATTWYPGGDSSSNDYWHFEGYLIG